MKARPAFRLDDFSLAGYLHCGTGLLCVELLGLDAEAADELHALARVELGDGPSRNGQPPKNPVAYRTAVPFRKRQTRLFTIDGYSSKVELLADGQQFVAFATHTATMESYH